MAYRVESVQDADLEYIVLHTFGTFGNSYEFLNIMYAGHQTETGQISIASRFSTIKNGSPNTKWIKAVAKDPEEIAGFSMWTIIDQEKPPEADLKGGSWSNKEEEEYARALHKALLTDRRKTIRENELPIMTLNMMVVFTPHQREGAGKQLLAWGLQLVDQLQALCTVEATVAAKQLYKEGGFVVQHDYYLDAGENFAAKPKDHLLYMVRPRVHT